MRGSGHIFQVLPAFGTWDLATISKRPAISSRSLAGNIFFNCTICETCKQTCLILRRSETWAPIHQFAVCNPTSLKDTNPGSCDAISILVARTEDRNSSSCLTTHATSATVAAAKLPSVDGVFVEIRDDVKLAQLVRARDCVSLEVVGLILAKISKPENSNLHGFEVHSFSSKGAKLLFQVIKEINNQEMDELL